MHSGKRLASPSARMRHSGKRLASPTARGRHSGKSVSKIAPSISAVKYHFSSTGASLPRVLFFPECNTRGRASSLSAQFLALGEAIDTWKSLFPECPIFSTRGSNRTLREVMDTRGISILPYCADVGNSGALLWRIAFSIRREPMMRFFSFASSENSACQSFLVLCS
jgi:hypothetical protein